MLLGFGAVIIVPLCGCFAMLNYTDKIFAESGSDMSPIAAAIIVGAIQLVGVFGSLILIDKLGRKVTLQLTCYNF